MPRAPDPSPKTFRLFSWLAQAKTKTAKSGFPAYFHFTVRRNFICFRGNRFHPRHADFTCPRQRTNFTACGTMPRACPSSKTFQNFFLLAQAETRVAKIIYEINSRGRAFLKKRPPPVPYPKNFSSFFLLARTQIKTT